MISRLAFSIIVFHLTLGPPASVLAADEPLVPSILLFVESDEFGDSFGSALAGVGDVNGDGVPDFLVGAKFADPGGIFRAGRSSLRSGATGEELLRLEGEAIIDNFGRSVAGIGDISGDSVPDLLIGASGAILNGQTLVGRASVHSGANGQELFRFKGEGERELFGWAVTGLGDVTGDGVPDMAVGSFSRLLQGRVSVFSGRDGVADHWRTGRY